VNSTETEPRKRRGARLNLWTLRFARNWLRIVLVIIGVYAALPWVAPTLMRIGATAPARLLYTLYSPFCHQFAFRSLFLYGEQTFYPRAISGTPLVPFETAIDGSPEWRAALEAWLRDSGRASAIRPEDVSVTEWTADLQFGSRYFVGNEHMGYKTALCARDAAIYSGIFAGGLIYSIPFVRRRLRPVPLLLYAFLGLAPIGIDGFSQLLGYPPFNLWQPRETEPIFRVVTGALFGLMNAWLGFPYLESSFADTRAQIESKLARAGIRV
jgi:uncharacterized membrane protein